MERLWIEQLAIAIVLASASSAQVTQRVSVNRLGEQGDDRSLGAALSADGRHVAFLSYAQNLAPAVTNGIPQVYVRDRALGATELVSVGWAGIPANGSCFDAEISADGRYVTFHSQSNNLVPGDTGISDVFVRDRRHGTIERVSVSSSGVPGDSSSGSQAISADGRYVAFASYATNLVPGDTNFISDVFVRDRELDATERISVTSSGFQVQGGSYMPSISADGRYVAFSSDSDDLVQGDANGAVDAFVRDRVTGTTERVSIDSTGGPANGDSVAWAISSDGRWVSFQSYASNLVADDTNGVGDVFVHDRQHGTTVRVSIGVNGAQGNGQSYGGSISSDGRYVAFYSEASSLVPGDTNWVSDIFVHDRRTGETQIASVSSTGAPSGQMMGPYPPALSSDGRFVAFDTTASNLVPEDTNGWYTSDVFVRDLAHEAFASVCNPGVAGVIGCPCANPPSNRDRGCDNSAGTGGASLSVSGGEHLSSDSIVFTTTGELSNALSVVLQGTAPIASGEVYGKGVRCVGGTLNRLYAWIAVDGAVTTPNFSLGEPTVHARSAARGDLISAGSTRWYMVYYRDVGEMSGCPAAGRFNVTQAREITWLP